jgi:uncharacterized coiled-coil DUF342 family protein
MKKGILINEKKRIREQLNAMKGQADKLMSQSKGARREVKFTNLADIEKEIKHLVQKQQTTSMSLQDEKKLIKELDSLQASKATVASISATEGQIANTKEQRSLMMSQLREKDLEIDEVQKIIDVKQEAVKAMSDKDTSNRDVLTKLFTDRDEIRDAVTAQIKEKNKLRDEFRKTNDDFYNYQRAVKVQKQMQWEEGQKQREEDRAAEEKTRVEEELKKIPYEEEQLLCEYLAKYLSTTYLETEEKKGEDAEKKGDVVALTTDPFSNFKPVSKKQDEIFFSTTGGKKKKGKKKPQEKKLDIKAKFVLNLDSFEQFGLLDLVPPTSLAEVPKSVDDLKAKKVWYSVQERGSVKTAKEIRKANQAAAASVKQQGNKSADKSSNGGGKKKGAAFSLSTDDFVPLGGTAPGSSAPFNSSWGAAKEAEVVQEEVADYPELTHEEAVDYPALSEE